LEMDAGFVRQRRRGVMCRVSRFVRSIPTPWYCCPKTLDSGLGRAAQSHMRRLLLTTLLCALTLTANAQSDVDTDKMRLERLRQNLVGHENEPADTYFKNISILKGRAASRLPGMMEALTGLIGVHCEHCHVLDDFASDEKPAKKMARAHFAMQARLNREEFGGENKVSCWTCHHGKPKPELTGGGH